MQFFRAYNTSGSGAVAITLQRDEAYRVAEVRLHLGATATDLDDLTVSLDSELGAGYDTILAAPDPDATDLTAGVTPIRCHL